MLNTTALIEKPKSVVFAVQILWTTFAISILNIALNWNYLMQHMAEINIQVPENNVIYYTNFFLISILVVCFLINLWLILKISAGRNWARIVCLIGVIYSIIYTFINFKNNFSNFLAMSLISIFNLLLQSVALYYLYTKPSNVWFQFIKLQKNHLNLNKLIFAGQERERETPLTSN